MALKNMSRESRVYNGVNWINIEEVTEDDTLYLGRAFGFHPLDLNDCLGATQRPKIDLYDKYFFLVLHFPFLDKSRTLTRGKHGGESQMLWNVRDKRKKMLKTAELNVFLTHDHLITIQKEPIFHVRELFKLLEAEFNKGEEMPKSSAVLLYLLLDKLYHRFLTVIGDLTSHLSITENHIYDLKARDAVRELAIARRNNLSLRNTLNPQRLVINTLAHIQREWFNKDGEVTLYYDDILDYLEKNWIVLENHKELIDGFHETNESLISYRTNMIITILTVFSVSLLPLTLLTGFYGMNLHLPFASEPRVILTLFFVVAVTTFSLVYYILRKKKWV